MVEELDRLEVLRKKDLMAINRILAAQRDLTRLKGEWGGLVAQIARAQGQISETELQILASTRLCKPNPPRSCARWRRAWPSSPSAKLLPRTS